MSMAARHLIDAMSDTTRTHINWIELTLYGSVLTSVSHHSTLCTSSAGSASLRLRGRYEVPKRPESELLIQGLCWLVLELETHRGAAEHAEDAQRVK